MADFPALFQGIAGTNAATQPPLPDGFTLDAAPNSGLTQRKSTSGPSAEFDLSKLPGLPDGFTLDSDPSISNPQGTAVGRALQRGVLRTRSTLPAIQAQKGATVLADAALAEPDLIRNVFLETTRLPDVPEGVDISTPELASAAIAQMGYPADFANVFRQTYDIRARDAAAAVGNETEVLQTATGNIQQAQGLNDQAAAIPHSPAADAFKQVLAASPDTVLDVLKAYAQNPGTALAFLGETAAESLPQMGASAVTTLATRSPAAGAAVLGAGTLTQEFGSSVNEFFAEQGVSPKTPEEAEALIRNPEFMAAASRRGVGRGVVIALAEMAGQGVAATQLFKGAVKEAGKDVTAQMATGAGGETGARLATGQDLSAKEIVTEALAEGVAAPVEVGATVYQSRKNAQQANEPAPVVEQLPALPSGYVLDSKSAGQLRTSDVQPLEAPTKVPDATRLEEPTLGSGVAQGGVNTQTDQPYYSSDSDFVVPAFNHFSDEADYQNRGETHITEAVDAALTPEVKAKALALHGGSEPWFQVGRSALIARLIARGGSLSKEVENFTTQRPGQRRQYTTQESLDIYAKARRVFSDRLADPQLSRNQRYELERQLELAEKMEAHVRKKMAAAMP